MRLSLHAEKDISVRVIHLFHAYLATTQNWCYQLIKNLSSVELIIVSDRIENDGAFPLPHARFIIAPYARWRTDLPRLLQKAVNRVRLMLDPVWRRFIVFRIPDADIMHAHFSFVGWNYLWLSRVKKIPLVISFYGFDYEHLPNSRPVWAKRYRRLFAQASLFIVEGTAGRSKLIEMGCPSEKVKVVHLGVPVADIPYCERGKKRNELKLVQIASFAEKKGYDVTIKAFMKAFPRCPGMTLTLVGKDPQRMRDPLRRLVDDAGLARRVEFIDGIDFAQLYSFLNNHHVFIHPSRYGKNGDSEGGAPVVLLDAQASGMPVLSTFHCDIPDEVIHGKTGILVDENDIDGLADAIETFYSMEEPVYHTYCKNARNHVAQNYDVVKCAAELKTVYENLLNGKMNGG
jgi:colanic acid/amylovoran biosynthesis glycosyltransferase